jgi:hypothetical protein
MHTSDTHNELPHRADELQDAPKLMALREQLREEVPKGYFNEFRERLAERLEDEKILTEAPELMKIGKDIHVDVPEGYFAAFHKRIMKKVLPAPVRSLWERPVVWAAAAGIVLLCTFAVLFQPLSTGSSTDQVAQELIEDLEDQELFAMLSIAGAEAEDVASIFSVEEVSFDDLEGFEGNDTEELLDNLDLSEADILDLLNETYQ